MADCMHEECRSSKRPDATDRRFWRWPGVWTVKANGPKCDLCNERLVPGDRFVELLVEEYNPPELYDVRYKWLCADCARQVADVIGRLGDGRGCDGEGCDREKCLHRVPRSLPRARGAQEPQ